MKRLRDASDDVARIIKVNAGGVLFVTFYETLTKSFPDCRLAKQFSELEKVPQDAEGNYFIDMNPAYFAIVLDILRTPKLLEVVPKDMPFGLFSRLLEDQELISHEPAAWQARYLAVQKAWKEQHARNDKIDREALAILMDLIDLPTLILSKDVSKTIYLPVGVYTLHDASGSADLPHFIRDSREVLQRLLDRVSDKTASLYIDDGAELEDKPREYVFLGVTYYGDKTPFFAVTIDIDAS